MQLKNYKYRKELFIEKLSNIIYNNLKTLILTSIILCFQSCGIYSFTGAAISSETKTISVGFFPNYSKQVQPSLSQVFTEKLKDVFISQTTLDLILKDGDLQLNGTDLVSQGRIKTSNKIPYII